MSNVGKIKVRSLSEITGYSGEKTPSDETRQPAAATCSSNTTTAPKKVTKRRQQQHKAAATTSKKKSMVEAEELSTASTSKRVPRTPVKRRTKEKEPPPNQTRIDNFFKSCGKTYKIEPDKENSSSKITPTRSSTKKRTKAIKSQTGSRQKQRGRKRLFDERSESTTVSSVSLSCLSEFSTKQRKRLPLTKTERKLRIEKIVKDVKVTDIVDLCTDEEEVEQLQVKVEIETKTKPSASTLRLPNTPPMVSIPAASPHSAEVKRVLAAEASPTKCTLPTPPHSNTTRSRPQSKCTANVPIAETRLDCMPRIEPSPSLSPSITAVSPSALSTTPPPPPLLPTPVSLPVSAVAVNGRMRKPRPCPPYKLVSGTNFAVDAFQFGQIAGVTHYFLSHFHADHYVGLNRKFAMPLYLSGITARLVRTMLAVDSKYLYELELGVSQQIDGIEVTAIDANHCPGAVMFVFKLPSGKCILHTGDFRACAEMESEPIFWNNWIDTIYLDTTYLSDKYDFCTQHESIDRAIWLIKEFHAKHVNKRILHICGGYVIGKEKFWSTLAKEFVFRVWTEENRRRALNAMDVYEYNQLLCDDPRLAQLHVISIGKLSYLTLVEYFKQFSSYFDILLAIRPSGWEKNSRPQYRGQINIVGIEYSEHSSHKELERFVRYLKPREVISTVPVARDPMVTCKIPQKWYKYGTLSSMQRNFQPSITSYIKMRPKSVLKTPTKRVANCLTPTKSPCLAAQNLSQLSIRAMATRMSEENVIEEPLNRTVDISINAAIDIKGIIDLDADADDDWMS